MSFDLDSLYGLIPAIYRIRDAELAQRLPLLDAGESAELRDLDAKAASGTALTPAEAEQRAVLTEKASSGPLRSLMKVLAEQIAQIEEDIDQLYDDQFIETCATWVIPYIGELIGHRQLRTGPLVAPRAEVANTIAYRRGKGTASTVARGAADVTDMPAAVVEYFQRLAVTQHINHIRPQVGTVRIAPRFDARDAKRAGAPIFDAEAAGGPFDATAHGADVRMIASRRGLYNIPNVGIFLWRLPFARRANSALRRIDDRRFLLDPLGIDRPLLAPRAAGASASEKSLRDIPLPLTRRRFAAALEAYYPAALHIEVDGAAPPASGIAVCNLGDTGPDPSTSAWGPGAPGKVSIDPELGRVLFPEPIAAERSVRGTYAVAGYDPIGGGDYDRRPSFSIGLAPEIRVPATQPSLAAALGDPGLAGRGMIEITATGPMPEADAPITVRAAAQATLEIRAADQSMPLASPLSPLVIIGGEGAEVVLNGLTLAGQSIIVPAMDGANTNRLEKLTLRHCTLVPGRSLDRAGRPVLPGAPSLIVESSNTAVEIAACITGALRIGREARLAVEASVIDANDPSAMAIADPDGVSPAGRISLRAVTVIGQIETEEMTLTSNAILLGAARSRRKQDGAVRFSYVAPGSALPRRYACVSTEEGGSGAPRFISLTFGTPGYARLAPSCTHTIGMGADDGAEMGAYHGTLEPLKLQRLTLWLDEYMRFGLSAGIFPVT